jgi:hypothetical protein
MSRYYYLTPASRWICQTGSWYDLDETDSCSSLGRPGVLARDEYHMDEYGKCQWLDYFEEFAGEALSIIANHIIDKYNNFLPHELEQFRSIAKYPPREFGGLFLIGQGALPTQTEGSLSTVPMPRSPNWDASTRQLTVGPILCRQYLRDAPNPMLVLARFQSEEWPESIDDPFNHSLTLCQTVKDLNRTLEPKCPIRFRPIGSGRRVAWIWNLRPRS